MLRRKAPGAPAPLDAAEVERRLSGLERLRVAGLIDELRYQQVRSGLLEAGVAPAPAPAPSPAPAAAASEAVTPPLAPASAGGAAPTWTMASAAPPPAVTHAQRSTTRRVRPAIGVAVGAIVLSTFLVLAAVAAVPARGQRLGSDSALSGLPWAGSTVPTATGTGSSDVAQSSTGSASNPIADALAQTPTPAPGMPQGSVIFGGSGTPIVWTAKSDGEIAATPITHGVDYTVVPAHRADVWLTMPVSKWLYGMRADADVSAVKGDLDNQIGIGCQTNGGRIGVSFTANDKGVWRVGVVQDNGPDIQVDGGVTQALHSARTGGRWSIVCTTSAADGSVHVMFAIDGTVLSDTTLPVSADTGWIPTVVACTCYSGPEEISVTNIVTSTVPR